MVVLGKYLKVRRLLSCCHLYLPVKKTEMSQNFRILLLFRACSRTNRMNKFLVTQHPITNSLNMYDYQN